jgi:hypothetical protein
MEPSVSVPRTILLRKSDLQLMHVNLKDVPYHVAFLVVQIRRSRDSVSIPTVLFSLLDGYTRKNTHSDPSRMSEDGIDRAN